MTKPQPQKSIEELSKDELTARLTEFRNFAESWDGTSFVRDSIVPKVLGIVLVFSVISVLGPFVLVFLYGGLEMVNLFNLRLNSTLSGITGLTWTASYSFAFLFFHAATLLLCWKGLLWWANELLPKAHRKHLLALQSELECRN